MAGDELVFEYGKTIKAGDSIEAALGILEENRFACKQRPEQDALLVVCNSFMRTGVYGGQQLEVRLTVIDDIIKEIDVIYV